MQAEGAKSKDTPRVLDELLHSAALGRSDQLRQMLRYIVEEELAGRGDQLTEYKIGVNALGRSADFAPEVDSSVRTRAYDLRKRLEEHYRANPDLPWRIELPKGTYRARIVRTSDPEVPPPPPSAPPPNVLPSARPHSFWLGFALGAACLAVFGLAFYFLKPTPAAEPAAQAIWGPLLTRGSTVSVILSTVPQLWVREFGSQPFPEKDPPFVLPPPTDPRFPEWYKRVTLNDPKNLILHPNSHSPLGGEAESAITLAGFLAARDVKLEILHGDRTGAPEIKDRNAVVLGRPEYCRAAAALQPAQGFAVRYVPERREFGVVSADGKQFFFRENSGGINYGLITVLTKNTDSGPKRTILFAGINSDGSDAAMDYLTSLLNLPELAAILRKDNDSTPGSFQVVVRSRSIDTRTIQAERVAIKILP